MSEPSFPLKFSGPFANGEYTAWRDGHHYLIRKWGKYSPWAVYHLEAGESHSLRESAMTQIDFGQMLSVAKGGADRHWHRITNNKPRCWRMTWHKIEERRPAGATDAEWIAQLEEGIGSLLETIEQLDQDDIQRYWPEFEGYAASLGTKDPCPDSNCFYCDPISITAVSADWIDPDGDKPVGWRDGHNNQDGAT